MTTTVDATPEQIAQVLEVLKRSMPRGAMIEQIRDQTGLSNEIIWSAIHALEHDGTIVGRSPFAYDPGAAAAAAKADPKYPER